MAPCSPLVNWYRRWLPYRLYACCRLLSCSADLPWRWRWYVPPKRLFTYGPHWPTSQNTATLTTGVRTRLLHMSLLSGAGSCGYLILCPRYPTQMPVPQKKYFPPSAKRPALTWPATFRWRQSTSSTAALGCLNTPTRQSVSATRPKRRLISKLPLSVNSSSGFNDKLAG
jgi:hypothetical protein